MDCLARAIVEKALGIDLSLRLQTDAAPIAITPMAHYATLSSSAQPKSAAGFDEVSNT
jgi:hypothetical protein